MSIPSWFVSPDRIHSSYVLLATLAGLAVAAGVLFRIGLAGWVLRALGLAFRGAIRKGFLLWERLLAWASGRSFWRSSSVSSSWAGWPAGGCRS